MYDCHYWDFHLAARFAPSTPSSSFSWGSPCPRACSSVPCPTASLFGVPSWSSVRWSTNCALYRRICSSTTARTRSVQPRSISSRHYSFRVISFYLFILFPLWPCFRHHIYLLIFGEEKTLARCRQGVGLSANNRSSRRPPVSSDAFRKSKFRSLGRRRLSCVVLTP